MVVAVEPQVRLYYALCGNITIHNAFNAWALNTALGKESGSILVPSLDFQEAASYGSLELKERDNPEDIGQPIDRVENVDDVLMSTIDGMRLDRLDLIKLDVEGMELDVLEGGFDTIDRFHPIIMLEWTKTDKMKLQIALDNMAYEYLQRGRTLLCYWMHDEAMQELRRMRDGTPS